MNDAMTRGWIAELPRNRRIATPCRPAPAAGRLPLYGLLAAFLGPAVSPGPIVSPGLTVSSGLAGSARAQVPDNRGIKLNPEDSVPPAYRDTLDERDRRRLDAARRGGGSFVPVLPGQGRAPGALSPGALSPGALPPAGGGAASARPAPSPASSLRRQPAGRTPPRATYEAYRPPRQAGGAPGRPEDRISEMLNVLLQTWSKAPPIVRIRYPAARLEETAPARSGTRTPEPAIPLPSAGDGIYGRTLYTVNSDYPGPVLIELLGPPLAGAVATGAFTRVGERMVLRLTGLEYRGRRVATDGWAVGLDCACYGIGGDVDRHFFARVLLPAAVRFAEGFLTALGQPAESVTLGGGEVRYERRRGASREAVHAGLGTAARTAGDILLEHAPKGPTVRIPRNTELIVLFARPPGTPPGVPALRNRGAGGG